MSTLESIADLRPTLFSPTLFDVLEVRVADSSTAKYPPETMR